MPEKWKRCIKSVTKKQSKYCIKNKFPRSKGCYNPYAICYKLRGSNRIKKSTRKFFDQSEGYLKYFYVHDDIHQVMAHYDRPIYEDMQTTSESAWCQKELWDNFSFEKSCRMRQRTIKK